MPTKYIYMLVLCSCNSRFEYLWADGTNVKKPIKCSAPKYIDYLMTWVQEQLDDETLFPSKIGELWFYFNMHLFYKQLRIFIRTQGAYFLGKIWILSCLIVA